MKEFTDVVGICNNCGSILWMSGEFDVDSDGNSEIYPCEYCDNDVQLKKECVYTE